MEADISYRLRTFKIPHKEEDIKKLAALWDADRVMDGQFDALDPMGAEPAVVFRPR